jgi:hypothetical protein
VKLFCKFFILIFLSEKFKEGFERFKEIQDIIFSNQCSLRLINEQIDEDIKKNLISFNPDLNDELRMKILGTKMSSLPLREEKFTKLVTNFIANKVNLHFTFYILESN